MSLSLPPITFTNFASMPQGNKQIDLCYPLEIIGDANFSKRPLIYFTRQPIKNSKIHGDSLVIAFPIPSGLQFSDTASWDGQLDGLLSTALAGASQEVIENISSGDSSVSGAAGTFISNLVNKATGVSAKDAIATATSKIPGTSPIQSVMNAASRSLPNPNVISQFTGSGQRTFSFKFSMVASSKAEAERIREIIKNFRISAYGEGNALRLRYPPEWNISFIFGGKEMDSLPKIANVVLTQVDTAINSQSGYSFHTDGSPIDIDLSLGFKETRVMTANDIDALEREGSMAIRYKTRNAFQSAAEAVASAAETVEGPRAVSVNPPTAPAPAPESQPRSSTPNPFRMMPIPR